MNKLYLTIIAAFIFQLASFAQYGVNKKRDFQIIENQLSEDLKVHSIEFEDGEDLLIRMKSPFEETQISFENFVSVAQYIIGKNYKPDILNIEKNVIIEMTDTLNYSYKSTIDIKTILYLEKFFDKTLNYLDTIFNSNYIGEETVISEFHKTDCFKRIINDGIESVSIAGIQKKELGKVNVNIVANASEEYYLRIYYLEDELNMIKCLVKN